MEIEEEVEKEIGCFVGEEEGILFCWGFGGNGGIVRGLLGENDIGLIEGYMERRGMGGVKGRNIKGIGDKEVE